MTAEAMCLCKQCGDPVTNGLGVTHPPHRLFKPCLHLSCWLKLQEHIRGPL